MNLRQIALGFAAALAFISGAHAEDAVVPNEFEQQQAVSACDAYGTGFAKMPGTNTCVRVSGALRYEKQFGDSQSRTHSGTYLGFETRSN